MNPPTSRVWMTLAGILLFLLACSPISLLPSAGTPSDQTSSNDTSGTTEENISQVDQWIEATLSLRSVTLESVVALPDADPKTLSAQIDATGNVHLSMPVPIPEAFAATPDFPQPGDFELFIVDGSAYTRIGEEQPVKPDEDYKSMLEDTLLGPEGPGLWLDLVPEGGFSKAGTETYGGFEATTYTVNYQIEQGNLSGMIWVDNRTKALVGAELMVSGGLFFPPGVENRGDVQITLKIQQDQVETITLP